MLAMLGGRPVNSKAAVPRLVEQYRLAELAVRGHDHASPAGDLPQGETDPAVTAANEVEDQDTATSAGQASDVGTISEVVNGATSHKISRQTHQNKSRWRQRQLRRHVVGATASIPISEMLAKLEGRREELKQEDSQGGELREIERILDQYQPAACVSRPVRLGQALPQVAHGMALKTNAEGGETGSASALSDFYAQFHI